MRLVEGNKQKIHEPQNDCLSAGINMVESVTVWSLGRVDRYNENINKYSFQFDVLKQSFSK